MINSDKRRAVAARTREIMRQYPDCLLDGMIAQSILDVIVIKKRGGACQSTRPSLA